MILSLKYISQHLKNTSHNIIAHMQLSADCKSPIQALPKASEPQ